jgi:hypothetical protein
MLSCSFRTDFQKSEVHQVAVLLDSVFLKMNTTMEVKARGGAGAQCSIIHQIIYMGSWMIQHMFRGARNRERCMLKENRDPDI